MAFARGGSGSATAAAIEHSSLKDLRASLPLGQRKIVAAVVERFERELIGALPELNAGVNTAQAEGSFSTTLKVVKAKKGRFKGSLSCRVRTPREPYELDMHIDDDGQLSLGLPKGWQADEPRAGADDGDPDDDGGPAY